MGTLSHRLMAMRMAEVVVTGLEEGRQEEGRQEGRITCFRTRL